MTNEMHQDQYQVIDNLLKRQDEALEQLDALSQQVELAINDTIASRDLSGAPEKMSAEHINTDEAA